MLMLMLMLMLAQSHAPQHAALSALVHASVHACRRTTDFKIAIGYLGKSHQSSLHFSSTIHQVCSIQINTIDHMKTVQTQQRYWPALLPALLLHMLLSLGLYCFSMFGACNQSTIVFLVIGIMIDLA